MVKIFQKGERIEYTQGDTFLMKISPEDDDVFIDSHTLEFVVANEPNKAEIIKNTYNLTDGAFIVSFSSKDRKIPYGNYIYKMVLRTADGMIVTQMSGEFIVIWGAGNMSGVQTGVLEIPVMKIKGTIDAYTKSQADAKFQDKLTEEQLLLLSPVFTFTNNTKAGWVKFAEIVFNVGKVTSATLHIKQNADLPHMHYDAIISMCFYLQNESGTIRMHFEQIAGRDITGNLLYTIDEENGKVAFYIKKMISFSWYATTDMIQNKENLTFFSEDYSSLVESVGGGVNATYLPHPSAGLSTTAKNLLITILQAGVYTSDQSANISALETALEKSVIPDTPILPEQPDTGIVQTDSTLAITSGVTVVQDGTILIIGGNDENEEVEQPDTGIVQTDSTLAITGGVTATQNGSILTIS